MESGEISSFTISPAGNIYFILNGKFYRSSNEGAPWDSTVLPGFMPSVRILTVTYANAILCQNRSGDTFRSSDRGSTWTQIGTNLLTGDYAFDAVSLPEGSIFISTYHQGILRSTDEGGNWVQVNSGLPTQLYPGWLALDSLGYLIDAIDPANFYRSAEPVTGLVVFHRDTAIAEGNSGIKEIAYPLWLHRACPDTVIVRYQLRNGTAKAGTNFLADSGDVVFLPGETLHTITVSILGDTIFENNKTIEVNLIPVHRATIANPSTGTITIMNDDSVMWCGVNARWNLLSVPVKSDDPRRAVLYPGSIIPAYSYENTYVAHDTLQTGKGYWIKFDSPHDFSMRGSPIPKDTIHLIAGWNLIGTLSFPITREQVSSPDPSLALSSFFGYINSQYAKIDTLKPQQGYWVKANKDADIILDIAPPAAASNSR